MMNADVAFFAVIADAVFIFVCPFFTCVLYTDIAAVFAVDDAALDADSSAMADADKCCCRCYLMLVILR